MEQFDPFAMCNDSYLSARACESVTRTLGECNDMGWDGYSMTKSFSNETTIFFAKRVGDARKRQIAMWKEELDKERIRLKANFAGGDRYVKQVQRPTLYPKVGRLLTDREECPEYRAALALVSLRQCDVGGGGTGVMAPSSSAQAGNVANAPHPDTVVQAAVDKRRLEEIEDYAERVIAMTNDDTEAGARYVASKMLPLEVAVRRCLHAVNAQLALGANPNERFLGGDTALHVAAVLGRDKIVEVLVRSGGNVDARDSMGDTPLIKAVRFGHFPVAQTLISVGCDVGARAWMPLCYSALDTAAQKGHIDLLHLLVRNGADLSATDARGNTAMHIAAFHGKLESISALIDAGANVASKNDEGCVPMLLAPNLGPDLFALLARGAAKNSARGLPSFGLDVGVEGDRVPLRLSPDTFTVAPNRHGGLPAVHAPSVRYKVKGG
eukprot:g18501.t1